MPHIAIHQEKAADKDALLKLCPFGAIELDSAGRLGINAGCKMCRMCVKKGGGVFELVEDAAQPVVDKSQWRGVAVVAEIDSGTMHPVTCELLGKAKELAAVVHENVICVMIGSGLEEKIKTVQEYGADEVFVYDAPELRYFRVEPYTAALEDFINRRKPSAVLVGGTVNGRSLAPRAAARFATGLTADCTILGMQENSDLDQIRPAYGGNIMAHINTPRTRPQFATVRYKIFPIPPKGEAHGTVTRCAVTPRMLATKAEVLDIRQKEAEAGIEDAEVLVVAGRGLKKADDLAMLEKLATLLNGHIASTRVLVESGWMDPRFQIGLSGRTVKPKLLIACGVSGAIQFVAGMDGSEKIIAINTDPEAPIFKVAHIGIVGDLYEVIPALIAKIERRKQEQEA